MTKLEEIRKLVATYKMVYQSMWEVLGEDRTRTIGNNYDLLVGEMQTVLDLIDSEEK